MFNKHVMIGAPCFLSKGLSCSTVVQTNNTVFCQKINNILQSTSLLCRSTLTNKAIQVSSDERRILLYIRLVFM